MNKDNEKYKFHSPSWSHSLPQRQPPCLHLCIFQRQCGPTDMSLSLCTCVYMCTYMCIYTCVHTCVHVYSITHTRCFLLCTKIDTDSPLCSTSLTSWRVLLMLLSGLYQKLLGSQLQLLQSAARAQHDYRISHPNQDTYQLKRPLIRDFPGGLVAKIPHSQCRGSWVGELGSHMLQLKISQATGEIGDPMCTN